ncbi:hypothetical protein C922_04901 [Plasmodium inui San Antonio 1]|uniref:2-C-methyl-D-erythritol 4-phosphate cytidylyltransferase n=1 Tax=Plasmodium inui San Antonio 1 TaxID=1237626 RepID=W6ZVD5_9APIC|nr:hypothetical protein C922_04901 [Plasmodium inui San Antonio 1]EUD64757.1 hypothetical protein C922_04901 [Plasmodium inui San Antonio 1]
MQFIVTRGGGVYKVGFFTPSRGEGKNRGECDKGGQLHATEGRGNVYGASTTRQKTPQQTSQEKQDLDLSETIRKTDQDHTQEYRKYEKSLEKKNIHAILLCGGIGKRTELANGKQLLMLNDFPVFLYSFNLLVKCNIIKSISLVCDSNYFHHVMDSINRLNAPLLRRKHERGFLRRGHSKNVLTLSEEHSERDTIQTIQFLKKNKFIIYDNEKGKCITHLDELLTDVMEKKRQHCVGEVENEPCRNTTNRRDTRGKGTNSSDEVKPSDVDSNRYKIIRLLESGPERVDSLLNALRGLDLSVQNGEYICRLLRGCAETSGEAGEAEEADEADEADGAGEADKADGSDSVDGGHPARKAHISHILVHDGARPFLSELDFFNLIYMATIGNNTILGARATDTIKRIGSEQQGEGCPRVKVNVDRQFIFLAQTPQIFSSHVLLQLCAKLISMRGAEVQKSRKTFTDTSSLFQHLTKKKVFALQARFPNFKITTPADVFLAIFLMGHLFKRSHGDVDMGMFNQAFVNSPSSYVPSNQFNDHFFYDSLGGKQRVLYHHFYYE